MSWTLTRYHFISLALIGLLLGIVLASSSLGAFGVEQQIDVCQLIGKHIPPPEPGHDPRRPGTMINRIITQIDQSVGDLWLANTEAESEWNFCNSLFGIASGVMRIQMAEGK